ncbi:MAG: sulfatase-like hydrolase/transferase [Actinomycetota bacterium]
MANGLGLSRRRRGRRNIPGGTPGKRVRPPIAALALALLVLPACDYSDPAARRPPRRPNVLIILTDDQRAEGTMSVMPATKRLFQSAGTYFPEAVTTTPLCCPSRASIFTGRYTHNHGLLVRVEKPSDVDRDTMLMRYLHDDGYRVGFFGKYLNGWPLRTGPPDVDRWAIFGHSLFSGYRGGNWNVNGTKRIVNEYSTTFMTRQARTFIRAGERNDRRPWALFVNTGAPHKPAIPEERYQGAPVPPFDVTDRIYEPNDRDKPAFIRDLRVSRSQSERLRAEQLRTLMSVDDMIEEIFDTMNVRGERDTIAIFMSDNGNFWGEHGNDGKFLPYEMSIRIPMYMRWPGRVDPGVVDRRLAANIDVTPTILDAVEIEPEHILDGKSLFEEWDRDDILVEFWESFHVPTWASIWSDGFQYTEYYDADGLVTDREHYDLEADPLQNENVLVDDDQSNDPDVDELSAQLRIYRGCAGQECP